MIKKLNYARRLDQFDTGKARSLVYQLNKAERDGKIDLKASF